jgi:hypothetical protein
MNKEFQIFSTFTRNLLLFCENILPLQQWSGLWMADWPPAQKGCANFVR